MTPIRRFVASFSLAGVVSGLAFGLISLTPSLLPRDVLVQGVLTGTAFAIGYGVARALAAIRRFFGLRGLAARGIGFLIRTVTGPLTRLLPPRTSMLLGGLTVGVVAVLLVNGVLLRSALHAGDTAIVSMQYSYLPSWLTLMVEPEAAGRAAQALFDEVYGAWQALPS